MTPEQLDALYKAFTWQNWVSVEINETIPLDSPLRSFLVSNPNNSAIAFLRYVDDNYYTLCVKFLTKKARLADREVFIPKEISSPELFVLATKTLVNFEKTVEDRDTM